MFKAGFHLLGGTRANYWSSCRGYTVSGGKRQTFKSKNRFSFDLPCAYERCFARVQVRNFSPSCRSGDNICQQHESFCDN